MVERISFSGQTAWPTHHWHAAKLAIVLAGPTRLPCLARTRRQIIEIDLNVTRNEEIQTAISVVVSPACAGTPAFARDTQLVCDISERTVPVVMVQPLNSEIADVEIWPTIVVV